MSEISTMRPSRMMATRVHKRCTSLRICEEKKNRHTTGVFLTNQVKELALHQRVKTSRRLIEEE